MWQRIKNRKTKWPDTYADYDLAFPESCADEAPFYNGVMSHRPTGSAMFSDDGQQMIMGNIDGTWDSVYTGIENSAQRHYTSNELSAGSARQTVLADNTLTAFHDENSLTPTKYNVNSSLFESNWYKDQTYNGNIYIPTSAQCGLSGAISGDGKVVLWGASDDFSVSSSSVDSYVLSWVWDASLQKTLVGTGGSVNITCGGWVLAGSSGFPSGLVGYDDLSYLSFMPSGTTVTGGFGYSVALNYDGTTAAISSPLEIYTNALGGTRRGRVNIYTRSGTTWTHQQTLIANSNNDVSPPEPGSYGQKVVLSADGNTLVVASPRALIGTTQRGAVFVYTRSGSVWTEAAVLTEPIASPIKGYGYDVSINSAGTCIVVGSCYPDNTNPYGKVYIYKGSGSTWVLEDTLVSPTNPSGYNNGFGTAISLSGNGKWLAVGEEGYSIVNLYAFKNSGWELIKVLNAGGFVPTNFNGFGAAVALDYNGRSLMVGARGGGFSPSVDRTWVYYRR